MVDLTEKPHGEAGYINGSFYVSEHKAIDHIKGDKTDKTVWERDPIQKLTKHKQLMGYRHDRSWFCMDTLKERNFLEELWRSSKAP